MVKAFWHQSSNFGDKLTPYILNKLNIPFQFAPRQAEFEHYIMCGSILTACNEHSIIWGAGIAQPFDLKTPKEILAVRGKKTRQFLLDKGLDCPEVYGDPAMILPLIYKPTLEKRRIIGIVPHISDTQNYTYSWNIQSKVERTIDYILESEYIQSSALHILITANAYGVPCSRIKCDNVIGGDFKFDDFFDTNYDLDKFISTCPFKEKL